MCQLLRYINPTQLIGTLAYYYIGILLHWHIITLAYYYNPEYP